MKEGIRMRLRRIFILIVLTVLFCTTYSFAVEPQITIKGEEISKPNATKILTIKISSEIEIGVVSGKIEANENITNINVTEKNNWNLTFNKDTGVFNIYKAEGSKTEEIMEIEYTTGSTEGTGRITLSNLKMTTIEYETKEVSNVVKDVTIEQETVEPDPEPEPTPNPDPNPTEVILTGIKVTKTPTKTTYTEGESFDKTGMIVTAEYSDGTNKTITNYTYTPSGALKTSDRKIIISYTAEGVTKTVEQEITVKEKFENSKEEDKKDEEVIPDKKLPNTGTKETIIIMLMAVIMVSIVLYFGYNKYKNI